MRVNWGLHRSFSLLLTCVPAARGGGRSLEVLCAETVSRAPPSGNVQHDRWLTEDPEPGFPQLQRQAHAPLLALKTQGAGVGDFCPHNSGFSFTFILFLLHL